MMQLSDFKDLIAILPVDYQASISKRATWQKHMRKSDGAGEALCWVLDKFSLSDSVILSRHDLRGLASENDLGRFVMATIVWGYTSGGRGNNVANVIEQFERLTDLLGSVVRSKSIPNWRVHYSEEVKNIKGLGLSTYTKFLNFLPVDVDGYGALMLDRRIIQVASSKFFPELSSLELSNSNKVDRYPSYLELMHKLAKSLEVTPERIEYFLFEFGLNLKLPSRS